MTEQVAADESSNARIAYVVEGGPASRAGLAVGDRLLALNGVPLTLDDKPYAALHLLMPMLSAFHVHAVGQFKVHHALYRYFEIASGCP